MSKKDEKENDDDAEIEEEESDEDIKDKKNMIDNVEQRKLKKQTNKNKQIIIDKKAKQNKNKKNNIKKFHINKNFEKEILATYKKLSKINKYKDDLKEEGEEGEEEEEMIESQIKSAYHLCEKKLRSAFEICQSDPYLIINRNIIDILDRISLNNKMNLNYIIANIYISLMNKESLFDYDDEDNFETNDLLIFVNKIIQFREEIKNTCINISYDYSLKQFLLFVIDKFDLDEDQYQSIQTVLDENKEIDHIKTIYTKKINFHFIQTLTNELESQPNIYEQYQIFIQNKKNIIKVIDNSDERDYNYCEYYLKLGKYLAYMYFNEDANLYISQGDDINEEEEDDDDEIMGETILLYNGEKNEKEIGIVNGEKFNVYMDDKIKQMKNNLGDIVFKYCQKYVNIKDIFEIQYIIFILISRLFVYQYEKHKKEINHILINSSINMCFFKNSPLNIISIFINKILESEKKEYSYLKNLLAKKLLEVKNKKGFLYKNIKKEDLISKKDSSIEEIISDYSIFLIQNDLKLSFLNQIVINSGEKFVFYEEINYRNSLLYFCFDLSEFDIKLTITDLSLDKEIFSRDRVYGGLQTPLKIIMFFTEPRILKFEFDNSYSWFRSKIIKYKTNVFYPKFAYKINKQVLIDKYIKDIARNKKYLNKKKKKKEEIIEEENINDKLLIVKINGNSKVFNVLNVKKNLDSLNLMWKNKNISIFYLYIKLKEKDENKSYFYYYSKNDNNELIEIELTKENFENYLNQELTKIKSDLLIINLYIINNISIESSDSDNSLEKLLGFEPSLRAEGALSKSLFFIQNLNQAEILYYLYKKLIKGESIDIIILINFTNFTGYQISLYNNEEIIDSIKEFDNLNKEITSEENAKIICEGIKKLEFGEERNICIIIGNSMDNNIDNILEKLKENIIKIENENKNKNINVIKVNKEFNNEFMINSHIFYLNK